MHLQLILTTVGSGEGGGGSGTAFSVSELVGDDIAAVLQVCCFGDCGALLGIGGDGAG